MGDLITWHPDLEEDNGVGMILKIMGSARRRLRCKVYWFHTREMQWIYPRDLEVVCEGR